MKKELIILIILAGLFSFKHTFSQKIIKGELINKQVVIKPTGINKGESFKIEIGSLSKLLYQVTFKIDDYELISEAPSVLEKIFPLIPKSFDIHKEFKYIDSIRLSPEKELCKSVKEINLEIDIIKDSLIKFKSKESLICKNGLDRIIEIYKQYKLYYNFDSNENIVTSLYSNITFFKSYYNIIYKQSQNVNQIDFKNAEAISELTSCYNYISEIETDLIRGLKIIMEGSQEKDSLPFSSPNHLPTGDLTNIEVAIFDRFNPRDTLFLGQGELFVKNKFKVDFSVGLSANTLVDKKYFFTYDGDSIKNGIDFETTNPADIGLIALLHFDWKITQSLAFGPVAGISISAIDTKPRYMVGLGASFGKERTLTLSTGVSFGDMQKLSKQISSNGEDYNQSEISRFEEVPLASKLKTGYYFSITYNLTRTRAKRK